MADPTEIAELILISLSNLSSRNAHHEFEELGYHLARHVVTPNLLPPTGPVAGRGDQGRDFESFRGRQGDEGLVFACSLQANGIEAKIKSDVAKIVAVGEPVHMVYFICSAIVPDGDRHRIKDEVRAQFGIGLEIFHGRAIASLLADVDTFWIARRFLRIPEAVAPDESSTQADRRYRESKMRWSERTEPPTTYGDFEDLRLSGIASVFGTAPRTDIDFWLTHLRRLAKANGTHLERLAFYRYATLSLRGHNTMHGLEDEIALYFEDVSGLTADGDVEDAQTLLSYVATASRTSAVIIDGDRIDEWHRVLVDRLKELLTTAQTPTRKCNLLMNLGCLYAAPAGTGDPFQPERLELAISTWVSLCDVSSGTPFFRTTQLSRIVNELAPILIDLPNAHQLLETLDDRLSVSAGESKTAEMQRDRALTFMHAGRHIDAIHAYQKARMNWFANDALRGALLVSVFIGKCYEDLGLRYAAKLYYLSVGHHSLNNQTTELHDLVATTVLAAARVDYTAGNWAGAFELTNIGIHLLDNFEVHPWQEEDASRDSNFLQLFAPYGLARRLGFAGTDEMLAALEVHGLAAQVVDSTTWDDMAEEDILQRIREQFDSDIRPFADCGPTRTISSVASEISWEVSFQNNPVTARAAERFVAFAEIMSVALNATAISFEPTKLRILLVADGDTHGLQEIGDVDEAAWSIRIPTQAESPDSTKDVIVETYAAVFALYMSVLQPSRMEGERILQELSDDRTLDQLCPGGAYDDFLTTFIRSEHSPDLSSLRAEGKPLGGVITP